MPSLYGKLEAVDQCGTSYLEMFVRSRNMDGLGRSHRSGYTPTAPSSKSVSLGTQVRYPPDRRPVSPSLYSQLKPWPHRFQKCVGSDRMDQLYSGASSPASSLLTFNPTSGQTAQQVAAPTKVLEPDQEMQSQLEEFKRSVTIVFWYKVSKLRLTKSSPILKRIILAGKCRTAPSPADGAIFSLFTAFAVLFPDG